MEYKYICFQFPLLLHRWLVAPASSFETSSAMAKATNKLAACSESERTRRRQIGLEQSSCNETHDTYPWCGCRHLRCVEPPAHTSHRLCRPWAGHEERGRRAEDRETRPRNMRRQGNNLDKNINPNRGSVATHCPIPFDHSRTSLDCSGTDVLHGWLCAVMLCTNCHCVKKSNGN